MKRTQKSYKFRYKFSRSNFITGMGSVLNIQGKYFKSTFNLSGKNQDFKAIESDWNMVGNDLRKAFEQEDNNNKKMLLNE